MPYEALITLQDWITDNSSNNPAPWLTDPGKCIGGISRSCKAAGLHSTCHSMPHSWCEHSHMPLDNTGIAVGGAREMAAPSTV
eukprot:6612590-Prymnesium_polylepis.1